MVFIIRTYIIYTVRVCCCCCFQVERYVYENWRLFLRVFFFLLDYYSNLDGMRLCGDGVGVHES